MPDHTQPPCRTRTLTPAQQAYLAAFDAYLNAPRRERDNQFVNDLCMQALDDLLNEGLMEPCVERGRVRFRRRP